MSKPEEPPRSRVRTPNFPPRAVDESKGGHEVPKSRVQIKNFRRKTGEVALGSEKLIDPATSLAMINAILEGTDHQGRVLPQIRWFPARPSIDETFVIEKGLVVDSTTGQSVGVADKMLDTAAKTGYLGGVGLTPGKGYGMRLYLETARELLAGGFDFRNDPSRCTEAAVGMWHKLRDAGLATPVKEFHEASPGEYEGYYVINGNNLPKTPDATPTGT